jgi:hypothetical protein
VWVRFVKWFVKGAGSSGRNGFNIHDERIIQEEFIFQHSEYFDRGHMAALWIPFLSRPSLPAPGTIKPIKFPSSPPPFGLYFIYGVLLTGVALFTYSYFLQPAPLLGSTSSQIPEVFKEIVEGNPVGDCASESRGSSVQMFENGWLLADFVENLHFAIWRQGDGVDWLKVSASSLVTEPSCAAVKGAQLLQLGFRAQYCAANSEALRTALGSPLDEETRAWVQYQGFSSGLLIYGLPGKKLQPENPVFQVLVAAFLDHESDDDVGRGRIRAITADSSERDAYCTALWYPAAKDLTMSAIQQAHLSKCLTAVRPEHYSEKRKWCSVYGY